MQILSEIVKYVAWPFDYLTFMATCGGLTALFALLSRRHTPSAVLGFSIPPLIFCSVMTAAVISGWIDNPALWEIQRGDLPPAAMVAALILAATTLVSSYALIRGAPLWRPSLLLYAVVMAYVLLNSSVMYIMAVMQ